MKGWQASHSASSQVLYNGLQKRGDIGAGVLVPCKVDWSRVHLWCEAPVASCRHLSNDAGVPAVSKRFFSRQSNLLKELDAPSSVAEFANVQAKLESDTKDTGDKMEGGCLREFTRFLEKEVRATLRARPPAPSHHTKAAHPSPIL